jgi:cellulose synthase/poly-beta-1,6-N-acetylglucosamine synthase-like glycosyltransferase
VAVAIAVWSHAALFLYLLYIVVSLVIGAIGCTTLVWMVHAWRTPDCFRKSRLDGHDLQPAYSFSLIVPARHEETVLEATLSRLVMSDHPDFEVLVVVGADDPATREVAEGVANRHPQLVKVVVDASWPKNKPKALNAALPHCTGAITGVFDAEDDVHPALLQRVDQCFQKTDADVVQAGVQLMNFRSSWLTVRNVLEYYFWFRSRLHFHASQRFIPLGGNTVFVRTQVLRAVSGWDPDSLAEDCELGVRLSTLGAHTVVVYEPELVTREECPPTLGAFARQRTRWNQGYLQTLSKGYWRRLPPRQRALGVYTLAMPYMMALAWLMIPVAIATAVAVKAPVPLTLISFLPALPMLSILAVEVAGLGDFCRTYAEHPSARDYSRLVLGLPLYQAVLAFSAARAVAREALGVRGWEKTAHLGLHLAQRPDHTNGRSNGSLRAQPRRVRMRHSGSVPSRSRSLPPQRATAGPTELLPGAEWPAPAGLDGRFSVVNLNDGALSSGRNGHNNLNGGALSTGRNGHNNLNDGALSAGQNGHNNLNDGALSTEQNGHGTDDALFGLMGSEPLWIRLHGGATNGSASLSLPSSGPVGLAGTRAGRLGVRTLLHGLGDVRALLRAAVRSHPDAALQAVLLAVIAVVLATNLLHWPDTQFDEGTYVGNAWAVQHGRLAPYTYSYGHPPLAWLLIAVWTWASGIFGDGSYSIDGARQFMVLVSLVSCSLLYTLARRLGMSRAFAAGALVLFALSPLSVFFHRAVLLDNLSVPFVLGAFVFASTPQRRLWAFAASGACFAAGVLCKETSFVLLPALLWAAAQNSDKRTRRYCLTLFVSFLVVIGAAYPLYATLKGELLPGHGHVSLIGYTIIQLVTRQGTGSLFDPLSQTHIIVAGWLNIDAWLLVAGLALSPIALARRSTRGVALAFLIQVVMILRPGYLPNMYVIGLLPFAALIVAGGAESLWRTWRLRTPRALAWPVAGIVGVPVLVVAVLLVVRWTQGDHMAMTRKADGPTRAAERWVSDHLGRDKRVIVGDEFWIFLIEHGFDHHPVQGGFFSRTVISSWPLDYDPAVKRRYPHAWRDFDYIIATDAIRASLGQTPSAAQAIEHSRVVASFGQGQKKIEIRAITRGGG